MLDDEVVIAPMAAMIIEVITNCAKVWWVDKHFGKVLRTMHHMLQHLIRLKHIKKILRQPHEIHDADRYLHLLRIRPWLGTGTAHCGGCVGHWGEANR